MTRRCIFLALEAEKLSLLQDLRQRFDPLADKIPPHITVVFPFALDWEREALAWVLEQQRVALPIRFALGNPMARNGCLCFPLSSGQAEVTAVHEALHASLPPAILADIRYRPHVTFGWVAKGQNPEAALKAAGHILPFIGVCPTLVLERIGVDDESIPEFQVRGLGEPWLIKHA